MNIDQRSPLDRVTWYDLGMQREKSSDRVIRYKLDRAMKLGNLFKETVKLKFRNRDGHLEVSEAFVLTVTERYVILRGGLSIPIDSIYDIIF